jgi:rare lipoprotein A (peptidoglycan hydrolase)
LGQSAQAGPTTIRLGQSRLDVLAGRSALVTGSIRPAAGGVHMSLQRRTGGRWRTVDGATTRADGAFTLRFTSRRPGSLPVRVRAAASPSAGVGYRNLGRLNVYRQAAVSWYGPGLYGNRLGCGGVLRPGQLGVANKTLPCGSRVTLRNGARTIRVPVIDRGPYVGGREYDLTEATKNRLRFGGVGVILATA